MALIRDATILQADRLATRHSIAHRLRILETKGDQENPEDVQAVREQLQIADEAIKEALAMLDALKELIGTLSPGDQADFERRSHTSDSSLGVAGLSSDV